MGPCPNRKEMTRSACSSEMTKEPFDDDAVRAGVGNAVTSGSVLFLATLAFGLAMLALLGVLALADVVGVGSILPFFALPPALFIASGVLLWRWTSGERKEVGVREVARSHSSARTEHKRR
jgi:hypothetical protein